jgi:hypothetical protein
VWGCPFVPYLCPDGHFDCADTVFVTLKFLLGISRCVQRLAGLLYWAGERAESEAEEVEDLQVSHFRRFYG